MLLWSTQGTGPCARRGRKTPCSSSAGHAGCLHVLPSPARCIRCSKGTLSQHNQSRVCQGSLCCGRGAAEASEAMTGLQTYPDFNMGARGQHKEVAAGGRGAQGCCCCSSSAAPPGDVLVVAARHQQLLGTTLRPQAALKGGMVMPRGHDGWPAAWSVSSWAPCLLWEGTC